MIFSKGTFFTILIPAMLLLSCKKLNSSTLFLSTFCNECADDFETRIKNIDGVYYARIDTMKNSLTVHFENKRSLDKVELFLKNQGLVYDSTKTEVNLDSLDCCSSP